MSSTDRSECVLPLTDRFASEVVIVSGIRCIDICTSGTSGAGRTGETVVGSDIDSSYVGGRSFVGFLAVLWLFADSADAAADDDDAHDDEAAVDVDGVSLVSEDSVS